MMDDLDEVKNLKEKITTLENEPALVEKVEKEKQQKLEVLQAELKQDKLESGGVSLCHCAYHRSLLLTILIFAPR